MSDSDNWPEDVKFTSTIRTLSWYQTSYLGGLYKNADVLMIGRVDESGELVVQFKTFGKIDIVKIPFNPPTYE